MADMFSFGSWHPGGVYFAMVDGGVRFLTTRTDTKIFGLLEN
jgi:prepilin-type processing-associated H-X9-DG protein